jgi:hypothetical protein
MIPIIGGSRKAIQVIGFQSSGGQVQTYVGRSTIRGANIVAAIDDFIEPICGKTVLVLDNASPHTCNAVSSHPDEWAMKGLLLYRLPPYSSEPNAIEHLWNKLMHRMLPRTAWEYIETIGKSSLNALNTLGAVCQLEPIAAL